MTHQASPQDGGSCSPWSQKCAEIFDISIDVYNSTPQVHNFEDLQQLFARRKVVDLRKILCALAPRAGLQKNLNKDRLCEVLASEYRNVSLNGVLTDEQVHQVLRDYSPMPIQPEERAMKKRALGGQEEARTREPQLINAMNEVKECERHRITLDDVKKGLQKTSRSLM
jgi:hypothetical protein